MEYNEELSREEILAYQWEKLEKQIKRAYDNSPFYRKKFMKNGVKPEDIKNMDDFSKLPLTARHELIEDQQKNPPYGSNLSIPEEEIRYIFASPGPFVYPASLKDMEIHSDCIAKLYRTCGANPKDVFNITYTYFYVPAGMIFQEGAVRLGAKVTPGGVGQTKLQIEMMQRFGTTVFVGTPSFCIHIGDVAKELKVDLNLKIGCFSGEPLLESTRKEIESSLGLKAYNTYGNAPVGFNMARECDEANGMHVHEDYYYIEVLDPETLEPVNPGEPGEIVVSALNAYSFPFIRVRIGDLITMKYDRCACGRTEMRVMSILGRVDGATKVKGLFVYPHQVDSVVKKHPELERFQIVVDKPGRSDRITIRIGCKKENELLMNELAKEFKDVLRLDTVVELVEEIEKDANILVDLRDYI